jgi:hypothetical protein
MIIQASKALLRGGLGVASTEIVESEMFMMAPKVFEC